MPVTGPFSKLKSPGLPQVIPVLAVMMEVFWIFTWLLWLNTIPAFHWDSVPLNLISCLALGILVEVTSGLALNSHWSLKKVRWVIIPFCFLFLLFLIRLNLGGGYNLFDVNWFKYFSRMTSQLTTAVIFGIFIIWRGLSAGRQDCSFSGLYRRFVTGMAAIILVLVVWRFGSSQISNIWQSIGLEIVAFFGCGLLALAISNLERMRVELKQHQEATASFSRRWISMLIILVLAILGIGILMTGLLSPQTGTGIAHFLSNLGHWLLTGFLYLLYPLGYVAQALFWVVGYIVALIRRQNPPSPADANLGAPPQFLQQSGEGSLPQGLILALKWGSIIIVSVLVILILSRLLSRYWKVKTEEEVEEVQETLGSWNLLKMDLHGFLSWLFRWLHRRKPVQNENEARIYFSALESKSDKLYNIREIYQALLWEGRQNGTPRRTHETPNEYKRRLQEKHGDMIEELDAITEAYVVERYGMINPALEKVSWLNRVWRVLRDKFRNKDSGL